MNKKMLILSLLLSFFSLQSKATVVYVDSAHVGGTQSGTSWATSFSDFQAGINAANAGDSVWVAKGTYKPLVAYTSFTMKEGVKIFGGFLNTNTTFSQRNIENNLTMLTGNKNRVISNDSNALTNVTLIDGFRIWKGKPNDNFGGGGIYNNYASPTINNCLFASDTSYGSGGAICNRNSSTIINNCTFNKNYSDNSGGAIANLGGTIIIQNNVFNENTANFRGGAIDNGGSEELTINNCIFNKNMSVYESGGAISTGSSQNTNFQNSEFRENSSPSGSGGAIFVFDSATITNCRFVENVSFSGGGAVCGIEVDIYNSIFTGNKSTPSFYVDGGGAIAGGNIIDNCSFNENTSTKYGGAIQNARVIKNCRFNKNKAWMGGGAVCSISLSIEPWIVDKCIFLEDSAKFGGGLCALQSVIDVTNSLFVKNKADSVGGAIFLNYNSLLNLTNNTIVDNIAVNDGGGIFNSGNSYTGISNTLVWNNNSGIEGDNSAVYATSYSLIQGIAANSVNHNLDGATNPQFADVNLGDYRLLPTSACINMGNNDSIPTGITTDLAGNSRIWNNTVDMGAYEYTFALNLGNDTVLCSGNSIVLNAQNQGSSYLWNNGNTTQTITASTAGDYSVAVTNLWGTLTDTIHVSVVPSPTVNLGNDATIVTGNSITLNAGNSGSGYLWNTGATTQTITVNVTGTYSVVVTNNAGCIGTDTIVITVNPLGIGNINATANNITISPNPTKSTIHINITDNKLLHTKAILTDAYGRIVRTVMMENNTQLLSLAGLSSGIYILKMENGAAVKIVKE